MRVRQAQREDAYLIGYETERNATYYDAFCRQNQPSDGTESLFTTATSFAVPRAFFALFARSRKHFARIVACSFTAAIGALYFV